MGKFDDAIKFLTIATERGLSDAGTWNYLGGAYSSTNNFEKAKECFEKVLQANPQNLDAYKNLGSAYGNLHRLDKALEVFKEGLEINPADAQLNQLTGLAYEELGDAVDAQHYDSLAQQLMNPHRLH